MPSTWLERTFTTLSGSGLLLRSRRRTSKACDEKGGGSWRTMIYVEGLIHHYLMTDV